MYIIKIFLLETKYVNNGYSIMFFGRREKMKSDFIIEIIHIFL